MTLPIIPVEGFAVAYLWSTQLPDEAIAVNPNGGTTTIDIPPSTEDHPRLLIVSMATPELSTADSVLLP